MSAYILDLLCVPGLFSRGLPEEESEETRRNGGRRARPDETKDPSAPKRPADQDPDDKEVGQRRTR